MLLASVVVMATMFTVTFLGAKGFMELLAQQEEPIVHYGPIEPTVWVAFPPEPIQKTHYYVWVTEELQEELRRTKPKPKPKPAPAMVMDYGRIKRPASVRDLVAFPAV